MGELLHAIRDHKPLPAWAPPPAPAPNALNPLMADILARHFPLPRGEYPTAKWPEGCTHLPQGGAK